MLKKLSMLLVLIAVAMLFYALYQFYDIKQVLIQEGFLLVPVDTNTDFFSALGSMLSGLGTVVIAILTIVIAIANRDSLNIWKDTSKYEAIVSTTRQNNYLLYLFQNYCDTIRRGNFSYDYLSKLEASLRSGQLELVKSAATLDATLSLESQHSVLQGTSFNCSILWQEIEQIKLYMNDNDIKPNSELEVTSYVIISQSSDDHSDKLPKLGMGSEYETLYANLESRQRKIEKLFNNESRLIEMLKKEI